MEKSEEFQVETVISKRVKCNKQINNGRHEYFIKWEGYDDEFNTWEPLSNLVNCMQIIAAYEIE